MPLPFSNPFMLGAGLGLLGSAGQPISQGMNPFAAAIQQGLTFEDLMRKRQLEEQQREEALARQAMLDEFARRRLELAEASAGRDAAQDQRRATAEAAALEHKAVADEALAGLMALLGETGQGFEGPPRPGIEGDLRQQAAVASLAQGKDPLSVLAGLYPGDQDNFDREMREAEFNLSRRRLGLSERDLDLRERQLARGPVEKPPAPRSEFDINSKILDLQTKIYKERKGDSFLTPDEDRKLWEDAGEYVRRSLAGPEAAPTVELGNTEAMAAKIAEVAGKKQEEILADARRAVAEKKASSVEEALYKLAVAAGVL